MSRYHTDAEREALATLTVAFGYPLAGHIIRRDTRTIAVIDADVIEGDPQAAADELLLLREQGVQMVWIGEPPPP